MALIAANPALSQKQGGILRVYHRDSPASMSIHEEGTVGVIMPMMGVFNNLVAPSGSARRAGRIR
jgi:peptide/nickel transport system substrate-binding protein